MPVFRWGRNWNPFRDLEREVEGLLKRVNLTFQGLRVGRQFPAVNLFELPDEFVLTAELPGTRAADLELSVAGGILTIKGTAGEAEDVPEERFRRRERFRGNWQRSLTLPERVQEDRMKAEFHHGVLKVHLPKAAELTPRKIPVVEPGDTSEMRE